MKRIVNFRPLFFAFVALALGIRFSRDIFAGNLLVIIVFSVLLCALAIALIFYKKFVVLFVIAICFGAGLGLFYLDYNNFKGQTFEGKSFVYGRIKNIQDNSLILEDVQIQGKNVRNVKVYLYNSEVFLEQGDYLVFEARVSTYSLAEFGKINTYLYKNNLNYSCSVSLKEENVFSGDQKLSEKFKLAVKNILEENMSEDGAYFAYSILFGDRTVLNEEINENFTATGVSHILAVSGLHFGLLAGILYAILKKLKCKELIRFTITSVVLILYSYLCGFAPSVVRATLMTIILLSSKLFGRRYDFLNSISLAGIILLLFNPLMIFDLGFCLSFACVFSIALFDNFSTNTFLKLKMPKWLASSLAITLCTQIGILPFIANYFGHFSLVGMFSNLLLVPLFTVGYGILFMCLPFLAFPYINILLFISDLIFQFMMLIVNFVANLGVGNVKLYGIDIMIVLIFYLSFYMLSKFVMLNKKVKLSLFCTLLTVAFALACITNLTAFPKTVTYTQLNSYESCAIITTPNGKTVCIADGVTSKIETFLDVNNYNIDYYVCPKGVLDGEWINSDIVKDGITFKFYKSESHLVACLIKYDVLNFLYTFDQTPSTYDILNIKYDLIDENLTVLWQNDNEVYSQNLQSQAVLSKYHEANFYSLERLGNFTITFENDTIKNVRSLDK